MPTARLFIQKTSFFGFKYNTIPQKNPIFWLTIASSDY